MWIATSERQRVTEFTPAKWKRYGRQLRKLRQALGISQVSLAKKLGISNDMISRLEMGKHLLRRPLLVIDGWMRRHRG